MSKHVPNGRTQVYLAQLRWGARTADIQRRSQMSQTLDIGQQFLAEMDESVMESGYTQAAETITAAVEMTLEVLIDRSAIIEAYGEIAAHWANGQPEQQQQYVDHFKNKAKELVSQYMKDMLFYNKVSTWADNQIFARRNKNNINPDLLVGVMGMESQEGLDEVQSKAIRWQGYISSNNSRSALVNTYIYKVATETAFNEIKDQAIPSGVSKEDVDRSVDDLVEKHKNRLSQDHAYLDKQVEYILNQVNYRVEPTHNRKNKPGM